MINKMDFSFRLTNSNQNEQLYLLYNGVCVGILHNSQDVNITIRKLYPREKDGTLYITAGPQTIVADDFIVGPYYSWRPGADIPNFQKYLGKPKEILVDSFRSYFRTIKEEGFEMDLSGKDILDDILAIEEIEEDD